MNRKIAHVTDTHLDEQFLIDRGVDCRKNWSRILDDIASRGIDEIVFGGDIGERASNQWFFESLQSFDFSVVLGNHDYFDEAIKHYKQGIEGNQAALYYTQEDNFYKYIYLDSSLESISEIQFLWLKTELKTHKKIIIFIHHPVLAVDVKVDKKYPLAERDTLKDAFLQIDNEIILFCGHYHIDHEQVHQNITQYITPASSYQMEKYPNEIRINTEIFGYRIIEFAEEEIRTELILFD